MPKDNQGRSGPKASLSCETCRKRKIRCLRPETGGPDVAEASETPVGGASIASTSRQDANLPDCTPCKAIGTDCVTIYDRKRRGPFGTIPRSTLGGESGSRTPSSGQVAGMPTGGLPESRAIDQSLNLLAHSSGRVEHEVPLHTESGQAALYHPDTSWDHSGLMEGHTPNAEQGVGQPSQSITSNAHPMTPWSGLGEPKEHDRRNDISVSSHDPIGRQTLTYAKLDPGGADYGHHDTLRINASLEDAIPRDTAIYIISLYFDYVHALVPCVHRPSFLRRMHQHGDKTDPLFFALFLSVLAATIVHVPKALLPFQDEAPIEVASRCMSASRNVSTKLYDPPSLALVTIRYFDSVFYSLTNQPGAWVAALSEVRGLAIQMNLHRESSYVGYNPVETELRRRIFQTAFMADKSAACMQEQLMMIRTEDCDARPPYEIDDEFITEEAYLQQPEGSVSRLAGHRVIAQTFAIIGDVLTIRRAIARSTHPVNPATVLAQLRSLNVLNQRLLAVFDNLPEPLRIEPSPSPSPMSVGSGPTHPWESQALTDLNTYLTSLVSAVKNPPASEAWLVMQGNCHVTRSIARLTLISCRDELIASSGSVGSSSRTATERVLSLSYQITDQRDMVISDLLYSLRRIPMQPLSVNSRSIVNKIRFVAVTLLDSVVPPVNVSDAEMSAAVKNQDALLSFLNILSEIEQGLVDDYNSVQQPAI